MSTRSINARYKFYQTAIDKIGTFLLHTLALFVGFAAATPLVWAMFWAADHYGWISL